MVKNVTVIGGGLAGSEAAWQLAKRGIEVDLYEMRPKKNTPAHETANFAELVCTNSMRSNQLSNAVGLLKEEMRQLDSLIMKAADETAVPAGGALAVDRDKFSAVVTKTLKDLPNVHVHEEEITEIPKDGITIIAVPVYAGRVAPIALQRLRRLRGNNAPAILITVYGNRDYEDALVELRDETIQLGFTPLAAGAFIGEHSYSRPNMPIAEGRPDITDLQTAEQFGKDCLTKLEKDEILSDFYIKGNIPYRFVGPSTPAAPVCTEECFACGECIEVCPTHAIALSDEGKIETEITKCIKCCACVKECPNGARVFDTPYTPMLHQKCAARREPELFI